MKQFEAGKYDVIVVGAGHAGCEAALATARMGHKTLVVTMSLDSIALMPCSPSIGGTGKGQLLKEIDALGGQIGINADKTLIQSRMLNTAKGPAVHSLRAQADKKVYPKIMLEYLEKHNNLDIIEGIVEDLIIKDNKISGVVLNNNEKILAKSVILTTGTYLKANILIGEENTESGPHGEKRSNNLSDNLKKLGFSILRLKTGTPPRIKKDSIDFTKLQEECGDDTYLTFSFDLKPSYTTNKTKEIINDNLSRSAMYGGYATGVGPRYCPSIEDKIVRFSDKEKHQLFLEPESIHYDEWYLQGFSTSMPRDVQEKLVHSLPGLENAQITKYAYAIEYDAINSLQIKPTLETKIIENLYTAGQINGTSGYEEAAGQGLIAGINAGLKLLNKEPLILKRSDAYIGVLIDDLVTKGVKDPYRMLTSRAEFRLLLRHDNADLRLREMGYRCNTINEEQYSRLLEKKANINYLIEETKNNKLLITAEVKEIFKENNIECPKNSMNYYDLLKRPEITFKLIDQFHNFEYDKEIKNQVEIELKYQGYIKKAYKESEKLKKLEEKKIPYDIDYDAVKNLASEARQKLKEVRPLSLGQASRISGVNPVDISLLGIYLKKEYGKND